MENLRSGKKQTKKNPLLFESDNGKWWEMTCISSVRGGNAESVVRYSCDGDGEDEDGG